jgi:hypothetical protein
MTQATRDAWDTYAALPAQQLTNSLGETYYVSGYNWFVHFNQNRASIGWAPFVGNPVGGAPAQAVFTNVVVNKAPTNTAVCTFDVPPANTKNAIFSCCLLQSNARLIPPDRDFVQVDFILQPDLTNPITLSNLDDFFGDLVAGQRLFIRLQRQRDQGRAAARTQGNGIAA